MDFINEYVEVSSYCATCLMNTGQMMELYSVLKFLSVLIKINILRHIVYIHPHFKKF